MQMNGSGIICTGYFYYNPTVRDFGSVTASSYESGSPSSFSFTPGVGEVGRVKVSMPSYAENSRFYRIVFNGTYVSPNFIGSTSTDTHSSYLSGSGDYDIITSPVRYA